MKYTFTFLCLTIAAHLLAQRTLTMSDAVAKERALSPGNIQQAQWIPGTNAFTHVFNGKVVRETAKTADTLQILSLLNDNRKSSGLDSLKATPAITWLDEGRFFFTENGKYVVATLKGDVQTRCAIPTDAENTDAHKGTLRVAYTLGNDLYVQDGTTRSTVAKSEEDGIIYGKSVHREEFGITKGTFWSNGGDALAFYRMDERLVTTYPIYVLDSMPAQVRNIRYPYAGAASHHVTLGVYHVKTQKTVYLQTGEPEEQYLTNIAWSPDDKHILIYVVNRAQNHTWLNMYDAQSGALVRTIYEEQNDKWVEPEVPVVFLPGSSDRFVVQSERDGYNHLYLYDLQGNPLGDITKGKIVVTEFYGFDKKGENCFFQAADPTGMNRLVMKCPLATGRFENMTEAEGVHTALFNDDFTLFIDQHQSMKVPRNVYLREVKKGYDSLKQLYSAKGDYGGFTIGKTQLVTLKAADDTRLNGRLVLPANFDEKKKYPVLVYVYNGPHVQLVTNGWLGSANLWMHRLANEGIIVFTMDGRGSANRGFEFESAIHRRCGTVEVQDQLVGVKYLKSLPYVDSTRLGVYGWSYGGFMATSMLTRPECAGVFKCGVAGGAVTDWRMYEIMYTERYMDTPQENPEGYAQASTFTHLPNLKVPLLTMHGSSDNVVLWQHTLRYVRECVRKGIAVDYFVYPEHEHNVRGKDRVHLFEKIEAYLKEKL